MPLSRSMLTVASCEFCPNALPHVSSETSAWAFFSRHRYTLVEISEETVLVACSNRACKAELNKAIANRTEATA